jgi:hypothetical protein
MQVTEYRQLEDRLQKTVAELDKREKQLVANEQEVHHSSFFSFS